MTTNIATFANQAYSTLAGNVNSTATTIALQSGGGAAFTNPGANEYLPGTFIDAATGLITEVVWITAVSGDTLTIIRPSGGNNYLNEGSTNIARSWLAGDLFQALITAGSLNGFMQTTTQNLGRWLGTLVVTSTGSVTLAAGTTKIRVRGCGAGGGSGAVPATSGSQAACSGGGGGAAWGEVIISSGLTALSATIGAGGVAGVDGVSAGAGGNGGSTVLTGGFGTLTLPGGMGSSEGVVTTSLNYEGGAGPGSYPSETGCQIVYLAEGDPGSPGILLSTTNGGSGMGGSTPFGQGGTPVGASFPGQSGTGYGAGAGGAFNLPSNAARNGGAGTGGILIIDQFT